MTFFFFYTKIKQSTEEGGTPVDNTTTIIVAILSGGIGSGIMSIISAFLQRKWAKSDKRDERIDALVDAQKVLMIDRVKHLGKSYIEVGEITFDDKENMVEMHKAYKALGGNGHLDSIMHEVEKLKVV